MKLENKEATEYNQEELDYIHKMALKKNRLFKKETKGSFSAFLHEFYNCPEAFLENCGVKINYYKGGGYND